MYYKNAPVLIATKHEKERVIRPVFQDKIGCKLYVSNFDTDQFGTFTGEIPRAQNAFETCVLKAKTAAMAAHFKFSIASEGSFGPHPSIPILANAHEIMTFVDLENNWVIADQLITPKTNYKVLTLHPDTKIDSFLHSLHFPTHAVTLQVSSSKEVIAKGIKDRALLNNLIRTGFSKGDELLLASDMRAMMNPTRMESLSLLATKLAARVNRCCRACNTPGFGFVATTEQLLCSLCDKPTSMPRFEIWGCVACQNQEVQPRSDHLTQADPTFCNYCNP